MSYTEETEVKTAEPVSGTESTSTRSRFIEEFEEKHFESLADGQDTADKVPLADDGEQPEKPQKKKKRPFIQIPVIISICLVAASLLAYFAYQLFWISEPEGVTWVWSSETDNVNWYFEFKEDNVFKAYVGSFEITANYEKDKSDEKVNKLTVAAGIPYAQSLGCVFFGAQMNYDISGSRLTGSQKMTISYPDDPEHNEYVLKQTNEREPALDLPDDFKEDKELTGEWINLYSTDDAKQTIVFNNDGSMILSESYSYTAGNFSEIRRNCTYTAADNEIDITWKAEEAVVHHSEYVIKDGILTLDGASYYRADSKPSATADEAK